MSWAPRLLKIPYPATHPGGPWEGEDWGLSRIAESLDWVHERRGSVRRLRSREQWTSLGYKFEHLAGIWSAPKSRLISLYDTRHLRR
jgi:hypothetical protein